MEVKSLAEVLGLSEEDLKSADAVTESLVQRDNFKMTVKEFCEGVLDSVEYRRALLRRIVTDTLPPAIEIRLWDQGRGKPVERLELRDVTGLENLTTEQLREVIRQKHAEAARIVEDLDDVAVPDSKGTVTH